MNDQGVVSADGVHFTILRANLGRERKAAQDGWCAAFADALSEVLEQWGIKNVVCVISPAGVVGDKSWHHAVVKVGEKFYDSLGEWSPNIAVSRGFGGTYRVSECGMENDPEQAEMRAYYKIKLANSAKKILGGALRETLSSTAAMPLP